MTYIDNVRNPMLSIVNEIDRFVGIGYLEEKNNILSLLQKFSENHLAVRYLLNALSLSEIPTRLSGAQSFAIYDSKFCTIRINAWIPRPNVDQNAIQDFDRYFSIGVCHNHNFDFFTTVILGNGYYSEFRDTNNIDHSMEVGQKISFSNIRVEQLKFSQSTFIPRDNTFHTQYPVDDITLTLNVIPKNGFNQSGIQYLLEDDKKTIKRIIKSRS